MGKWASERKEWQPRGSACTSPYYLIKQSNHMVSKTESASERSGCTDTSYTRKSVRGLGAAISDGWAQKLRLSHFATLYAYQNGSWVLTDWS